MGDELDALTMEEVYSLFDDLDPSELYYDMMTGQVLTGEQLMQDWVIESGPYAPTEDWSTPLTPVEEETLKGELGLYPDSVSRMQAAQSTGATTSQGSGWKPPAPDTDVTNITLPKIGSDIAPVNIPSSGSGRGVLPFQPISVNTAMAPRSTAMGLARLLTGKQGGGDPFAATRERMGLARLLPQGGA